MRIAIVGYGIAGIAAAIFLRRQGHDIVHFEQADQPSFIGSGLLMQPAGLAVLEELGLLDGALARGARIARLRGSEVNGRTIMDLRYDEFDPGTFGLGLQRGALFELLRDADCGGADLQTGHEVFSVDPDSGVLIDSKDGTSEPFDLIIAADGAESRVRSALPSLVHRDRLYPWGARLCLLDDPHGIFVNEVVQHFSGIEHVSIWPVGSLQPGDTPRVTLSWRVAMSDDKPFDSRTLAAWKNRITMLCPRAEPLLHVISSPHDLLTATYRDAQLARFYEGRVVVLGDAAHSMSPQLGLGATMALLDAQALANAIAAQGDLPTALAAFDRNRRHKMVFYQWLSRAMTPLFQSGSPIAARARRGFHPLSRLRSVRRMMLTTLSGRPNKVFGTAR